MSLATPASARPRRARPVRLLLVVVAALIGLAVVVAIATAAIVLSGTTEIGLIRDRVRTALAGRLGAGFDVSVGKTVMLVDPELGLAIDIAAIEVMNAEGAVVLSLPAVRLGIDPASLLLLRLGVTRARISGATLALVADGAGGYRLDGGETPAAPGQPGDTVPAAGAAPGGLRGVATAVERFDRLLDDVVASPSGGLSVALDDGSLTIRDPAGDAPLVIRDLDLRVAVDADSSLKADLSAAGHAGYWSASLERQGAPDGGERRLSARFSQVMMRDLFPELAAADGSVSAEVPLYGSVDFVFRGNALDRAEGRLEVGAGVFEYGEDGEGILLDEATLHARWDVASGEIVVEPSALHIGPSGGSFTGVVRDEGGGRFAFSLQSRDAVLAPRDSPEAALETDLVEVTGSADLMSETLAFDRLVIQTPEGSFAAAGKLGFTGETPSLALAAELTPMPIAVWKQMWPPFLAPGARRWALDNILGGRITSARFDASVPAGILFRPETPELDAEAFRLDVGLEDATVRTFGGLPPISRASGHAVLAGSTFGVDLESGVATTPSGATVAVDAGAFGIDDVFDAGSDGVVEVALSADAAAVGELADAEPFHALARRSLSPADLSGSTKVSISLKVPLAFADGEEPEEAIDWKVVVDGTNLASKVPVEGRRFSNADVTIVATKAEVAINGKADIDGVPAAVSIAQPLSADGVDAPGAEQAAALALDRAARLRLGLDIESIVSGTVDAQVRSLPAGGEHYDLDLHRARLVVPGLGWSKGIGVPATMTFDVVPEAGGSRVENMELSGEGFGFAGSARLKDGEGLVSASITRFRLRPGDDIALDLKAEAGGYSVVATGESFDVRGVIAELKGDVEDGGETSDISVDARVRKLRGFGDRAITDASAAFSAKDGVPRALSVTGALKGGPISLDYRDDLARASLAASAANAGAVFEFLDLYGRVAGGHLAVAAERPAPTGPLAGTLSITGFAILDEPAMAEVITRAGPRSGAKVDTKQMHVEQMDAVFRYTGNEIFVDDAFLRGTAMGATFNGVFDLVRSFMSINGTYIPIYGINNAFSRVPVVGRILGGANAEGLIGVTFKVEGPIAAPRVFVNPLSAVAPGIFRKIFEFR